MDIARPEFLKKKRRKQATTAVIAVGIFLVVGFFVYRLKPASPTVDRGMVWIDTVKRGPMVREVRGLGTLTPEDIRWVAARTSGRVDRILLRPGATVEPDSVILILTNPDVLQAAQAADSQSTGAESELTSLRVTLESGVLAEESAAANAKAQFEQAKLHAAVDESLFKEGLVSELDVRLTRVTAEQAETLNNIEQKRFAFSKDSVAPQLSVKEAERDRFLALAKLRHEELDALSVRAGMHGVLQVLPVEVGAQVTPGLSLARVADPTKLKAEVRIAETQAKDMVIGLESQIDTRNGIIEGRVSRIDPSVQNGTVTVDVTLLGQLPLGARPDLSVDGTIELERLKDVVYVGRPVFGQEKSAITMFKVDPDGSHAVRTHVQLGRSSVNTIEIVSGLQPGDQVILSDMSQWDSADRLQLK